MDKNGHGLDTQVALQCQARRARLVSVAAFGSLLKLKLECKIGSSQLQDMHVRDGTCQYKKVVANIASHSIISRAIQQV